MCFKWKLPTDILSTTRSIMSDDIEFNALKWRFYFHPKFLLPDQATFECHKALLMQLRSSVGEDVYAKFGVLDYGWKRDHFFLQTDFKPFRQYTIWGSRNINKGIILSHRSDNNFKYTDIEVCNYKIS